MAKKATKKPAAGARSATRRRTAGGGQSRSAKGTATKPRKAKASRDSEGMGAADALVGLLESPLVAEVIAAGAAAALATITQQALTKRSAGSTKSALKEAAKAAAAAMGARLATEFDEIMKTAKESRAGEA